MAIPTKKVRVTDPQVLAYYKRRGYATSWEVCVKCRLPIRPEDDTVRLHDGFFEIEYCLCLEYTGEDDEYGKTKQAPY